MRQLQYLFMFILVATFFLPSCLKEDNVKAPSVQGVKFYQINETTKQFEEVVEPLKGISYTIGVQTDADITTIWPGGERVTVKKKGTQIDSLDINGNVVLSKSNCYKDYGLLKAQGLKTSQNVVGWIASYKYPVAGEFELTVVVTNHGYEGTNYKQVAVPFKVTIK